jgi:hypothetical protein
MGETQREKLFKKFNRLVGNEGAPEGIGNDYFLSANPTVTTSFQDKISRTLIPFRRPDLTQASRTNLLALIQ